MKSPVVPIVTLSLALLAYCSAAFSADSEQTPQIVRQTCFMCHSQEGNTPDLAFVPRLAHQNDTYIVEQLKAFRDGSRAGPPGMMYMWPISQSLSEEQIQVAAKWDADQPPAKPYPEDPAVNAEGRDIFQHGILKSSVAACASCHGPKAAGNGIFPRLASQTPQYLLAQLRYFKSGVRNDKNADVMKPIASHLTEEQMNAVAHYISTL